MTDPATPAAPRASLWSYPRYVVWLVSDTAKGLAGTLAGFAIPLLTLMVTDDPAKAGILGAAGTVAAVATTLVGGVLADRYNHLKLMVWGAATGAIISALFAVASATGKLTFGILLAVEIALALRSGIFDTGGEVAVKDVVPPAAMGRAQATNQGRDAALRLLGSPLGGVLLGVGGWLVAAVMTVAHTLSALTAAMLERNLAAESPHLADGPAVAPSPVRTAAPVARAVREIREGIAWVLSRADMRGIMVVITLANLGVNSGLTTAVYSLQQDGVAAATIGVVSAAIGVAMLLGALAAPALVTRIGVGALTIAGLAASAVSTGLLSAVRGPVAVAVIAGLGGLLIPALNAGLMGYFMVASPAALLGRANAAVAFIGMAATPLAPLIAGFGLAHLGRAATLGIAAAICALAVGTALATRALRHLPAEAHWAAYANQFADPAPAHAFPGD